MPKLKIWSKVEPKISEIDSPSMKIDTEITELESIRKISVVFLYDWSPVMKSEDLMNFYQGLYGRSWKYLLKTQNSVQKSHIFFQLETNRVKKNHLFFSPLQVYESLYKFSFLEPVKMQIYRFLATPTRALFKICFNSQKKDIMHGTCVKLTTHRIKAIHWLKRFRQELFPEG